LDHTFAQQVVDFVPLLAFQGAGLHLLECPDWSVVLGMNLEDEVFDNRDSFVRWVEEGADVGKALCIDVVPLLRSFRTDPRKEYRLPFREAKIESFFVEFVILSLDMRFLVVHDILPVGDRKCGWAKVMQGVGAEVDEGFHVVVDGLVPMFAYGK
jgi:hypothetical protein